MAEITASLVKELRERTGAGMMECKKALTENNGDIDAAAEWLRKSGLAKADKKASRVAAEGRIAMAQDGGKAVLVEINSETDFVAKDGNFITFTDAVAQAALASGAADVEALVHAIEDANSLEPQKVRDALAAIKFDSLYGPIAFGANGQINLPQLVVQVQDGQVVEVYNAKGFVTPPKYPMPAWNSH